MTWRVAAALLVLSIIGLAAAQGLYQIPYQYTTIVNTPTGPVEGGVNELGSFFLGIPYAAPPVGSLRFSPPAPRAPWTQPLNATTWGMECPQLGALATQTSEDCLNLCVYVPSNRSSAPAAPLPVIVFIPGGCFFMGSSDSLVYDAQALANAGDAIYVVINYRLGALGFMVTDSDLLNGNYGVMDMIFALTWVRDNIASFGGDPSRVIIDGESSGATAVATLITSPPVYENKLISGAIIQSNPYTVGLVSPSFAQKYGTMVATLVNCSATDLTCLRSVSANDIVTAETTAVQSILGSYEILLEPLQATCGWSPNIDGTIVPMDPMQAVLQGQWAKVPLLVGTTRDEGSLFAVEFALGFNNQSGIDISFTKYEFVLAAMVGLVDVIEVSRRYPHTSDQLAWQQLSDFITDWVFRCSLRAVARAAAESVPVYVYEYTVLLNSSAMNTLLFGRGGAWTIACTNMTCHGEDVLTTMGLINAYPWPDDYWPRLKNLTRVMGAYWGNFAGSLSPNQGNNDVDLQWPIFSTANDNYMMLDAAGIYTTTGLDSDNCDFFDSDVGYQYEGILRL